MHVSPTLGLNASTIISGAKRPLHIKMPVRPSDIRESSLTRSENLFCFYLPPSFLCVLPSKPAFTKKNNEMKDIQFFYTYLIMR